MGKFRANVSNAQVHFTAVLLLARGGWQIYNVCFWLSNLELSATLLAVQGQPRWEELLFTILHNLHHGGKLDTCLVTFCKQRITKGSRQTMCSVVHGSVLRWL